MNKPYQTPKNTKPVTTFVGWSSMNLHCFLRRWKIPSVTEVKHPLLSAFINSSNLSGRKVWYLRRNVAARCPAMARVWGGNLDITDVLQIFSTCEKIKKKYGQPLVSLGNWLLSTTNTFPIYVSSFEAKTCRVHMVKLAIQIQLRGKLLPCAGWTTQYWAVHSISDHFTPTESPSNPRYHLRKVVWLAG